MDCNQRQEYSHHLFLNGKAQYGSRCKPTTQRFNKNHANALGDPVPSYTTISEYSTEITREINRLENNNNSTNNKDSRSKKIRSLQEKLDTENQKGFGRDHNLSDYDDDAENYDSEEDIMFFQTVKYPMDMDQQDRFSITCYSYHMLAFRNEFTATENKSNISMTYGVQRSSPYRKKLGAGLNSPCLIIW